MDNIGNHNIENVGNNLSLPTRRERLSAFLKLKNHRRYLIIAVASISGVCAVLSLAYLNSDSGPEAVKLGRGVAGVEGASASALHKAMGEGEASYYGRKFAGRPTASGERFDPELPTAAHRTLPLGSRVRVTNTRNGESVVVRVNDRGPFHARRVIDLSRGAARQIGMLESGTARVRLALLL